ncbi:hypothetical protein ANO11243_003790 [Dothideomycetidae sp. 11243]|nr:hypothetical protein ANO11243_003790 [fungal sp. No.11243]
MLFTHHSHSGEFCTHATSSLEEVVLAAIARGMTSIALTEHMPREVEDHYPGEAELPILQGRDLFALFEAYHSEAERLRAAYSDRIHILIGFEAEWIRPDTLRIIRDLQRRYQFDMFVGSVHHVHTHPVDFDDDTLNKAREASGGSDAHLAAAYFDSQLEMLQALKPPVVGHFDLIRLKVLSENRDRDWRHWEEGVWDRIVRNLKFVREYGGLVEVNSAALRKGLADVYPRREIMQEWASMGGKLTLSDDSHGVDQLCTHYTQALDCVKKAGIKELSYLVASEERALTIQSVDIEQVRERLK